MPPKKEPQPVTAMVPVDREEVATNVLAPSTYEQARDFANIVSRSGLCPKDFVGKPEACFVAMQYGAEVGLKPMQAIQSIAVINGRPVIWGDAMLAVVMASPRYEWHREWIDGEGDKMVAHIQVKRRGQEMHQVDYSVTDAKVAKLWNKKSWDGKDTPWITNPKRMLQLRARAFGLRDKFADVLKGLQMAEEVQDYIVDVPPRQAPIKAKLEEPKPEDEKQITEIPVEPNGADVPLKESGAGRREDSLYLHGTVNGLEGGTTKKGTKWCRLSVDTGHDTVTVFNYHASLLEACATSAHRDLHVWIHKQPKPSGEPGETIYVLDDVRSIDDMAYEKGIPVAKVEAGTEFFEGDESQQES